MERLWSRAVATSRNLWQKGRPRKRLAEAKTLAVGCDRLPPGPYGKEGVDGSSPSEGFTKFLADRLIVFSRLATVSRLGVHRASTPFRGRARRGVETLFPSASEDLGGGVHPASTARSIASASSSETACSRLSRVRWP